MEKKLFLSKGIFNCINNTLWNSSYLRQIAHLIYEYGKARQVGWTLRRLKLPSNIPWHRVINSKGLITMRVSRNGTDWMQKELLINEGIKFNAEMKIDIKKYLWEPKVAHNRQ